MRRTLVLVALATMLVGGAWGGQWVAAQDTMEASLTMPIPGLGSGACFVAALSGTQEVPPNDSTGTGAGTFVLSPDGTQLVFHIEFSGLTTEETVRHIHRGAPGVAGPVVFDLPAGSPKDGVIELTAENRADLQAGLYYVNIHSETFPGGELRGQILPAGGCYSAQLSGDQEVPPNDSAGTGTGIFTLAPDGSWLTYFIEFSDLGTPETVRHIHRGAPGVAGPVVFDLPEGSPKTGTIGLEEEQRAEYLAGLYYVNIHSEEFPGGELRGQISAASACFATTLAGSNEVPPNDSAGTGKGYFALSPDGTQLRYTIMFEGLTTDETVRHIHRGAPGIAGPVVFDLPAGSPKRGMLELAPADRTDLQAGLFYVNIHSETFPGGELRGQIVQAPCSTYVPLVSTTQP